MDLLSDPVTIASCQERERNVILTKRELKLTKLLDKKANCTWSIWFQTVPALAHRHAPPSQEAPRFLPATALQHITHYFQSEGFSF